MYSIQIRDDGRVEVAGRQCHQTRLDVFSPCRVNRHVAVEGIDRATLDALLNAAMTEIR